MQEVIEYIKSFLVYHREDLKPLLGYTRNRLEFENYKLVIYPSQKIFSSEYGLKSSLPKNAVDVLDMSKISQFASLGSKLDRKIPILYGENKIEVLEHSCGKTIVLYADFVEASYFFLSRYEEMLFASDKEYIDRHSRFLGTKSWAAQNGYIRDVLVDRMAQFVIGLLEPIACQGELERSVAADFAASAAASASFSAASSATSAAFAAASAAVFEPQKTQNYFQNIYLTHDLDSIFRFRSNKSAIRSLLLGRGLFRTLKNRFGKYTFDPYFTFYQIDKQDEEIPSAKKIYFIRSLKKKTPCREDYPFYKLKSKACKSLLRHWKNKGYLLGIHPSYYCGENGSVLKEEKSHLEKHIGQKINLSRHHFLRFINLEDIDTLCENGIEMDFSMGYAQILGFRLQTCRVCRAINPKTRRLSNLEYVPLSCMDSTLFEKDYMNLGLQDAKRAVIDIIDTVYKYGGSLNLLWHNTSFCNEKTLDVPARPVLEDKACALKDGDKTCAAVKAAALNVEDDAPNVESDAPNVEADAPNVESDATNDWNISEIVYKTALEHIKTLQAAEQTSEPEPTSPTSESPAEPEPPDTAEPAAEPTTEPAAEPTTMRTTCGSAQAS